MDEIEEKSNIVDLNIESTNDEPNNVEPDSNIPRTLPDLEINDSAPDSKENNENVNSPNFILDSEETKEKPLLTIKDNENFDKNTNENNNENNNDESNNNEQNNEKDESNGGELTDIVPGSVGNKIRHFEVIQEEKKKEKIPPVKMTRKAFRSRVNSTQVYKRESLALLASNADNKLRIQTVISQLFNNNEENTSNSNSNTPVTTRSSRINSFKNQLSNKEMTMETFLKKIRQNNGEIEEEDEENIKENETVITNNIKDEENIKENETVITNNIKDEDDVKYNNNKSENIIENNENKNNIEVENTNNKNFNKCNKRNSRADLPSIISKNLEFQQCTSQNSPLRTTSNIPENEGLNENSGNNDNIEINNKVIENENVNIVNKSDINDESGFHEIKLDSKSSLKQPFHFQSQQNVNEYDKELDVKQSLSLSSNELIKSKTDCSLNKVDVIQPLDKQHVAVSDTQLNTMNSVKKFKTQFIKISSKKNSRANIKSIHVKGNGEHSNSNSQENMNPSLDSVSDDSVSSINNLNNTRKASSDQNNRHPIEVLPLKINTKMTSDTNLYRCKKNDMIMSSKSSKSFVAIPTVISKKQLNKNSKPVEMRHITKKSSISTISSHSDDESISSPISAPVNDKLSSPANEKRLSRLNEYDTDILYEYFEEESLDDIINSESLSIRSLSVDSTRTQNNKPNSLSIKTNVKHNVPGLGSNDIMTSGVTPLDQVYNSISEELEQRLCKTVRHSILQRVDSNNFMIPINILYEKYYKTQVIYVERKMTIEEVLQQALNSINIYEDYGNYDLLQVFGFEDIIEEEEENNIAEENETKKNESDEEKSNSSLECNGKYQNVLDPTENVESILENTFSGSNRKTNNILTFRIRKKSSTMKLQIYLEEEKKYYKVMVTKKTTCSDVIKALLFLINEPYSENNWYIQRKHLDNYEEGKDILELTDTLYNKEEKIKYILKRKNSKQMSKLANLLGVTDESDLHNIVDNKESKKKKDKDKASKSTNELIKFEPLKDSCDTLNEYSEENSELFSRILSLDKEEIYRIYLRNKKLNNNKKKLEKKKCGSLDQLNLNSGSSSSIKEGERFSSQVFNIFKSKKEKRLSKLRDSMGTGSMPALSLLKDDNSKDSKDDLTKYDENGTKEFSSSNNDLLEPGKRAKKLGNFFGVNPYQRENTELNNIIRKNYNSKKAMDNAQQFVVIRVYFANFSFTTVNMSINDTCKTLKKILCEKLGVKESDEGLYQIYEFTQKNGYQREVHNSERPFDTMRRWQKDEIFLFKLKNNNPKVKSQNRNFPEMNNPENMCKSPVVSNNNIATASENPEQPVKRMAKLAGFFGVMNSKQEEKNNSEAEVKELFNMLHVMSNSKEEATKHIIHFIHSNDVIIGNSVKEGWLYMQVGKYWFNSWCYKDNNGGFNIKNWKSGDIMRIMVSDIVLAELMEGKSSGSSGDNVFQIVVKKPGSRSSSQYLFKAKYVIDAIEWVTSLKPSNAAETQKVIIEDDSNFKENFDALNIIGKGKYSVVFLCKQLATQEPYAVKILNCQYKDMWEVEKDILKSISHPFIVDIFQAFEYEEHNYLVMDFINGGDLYFHLSQYGRFSELRVRFYAAEILLALESLHGHDIIYRDLKLENIMITKEGHIKIIDFGQSVPKLYMNVDEVSSMSNIEYIAPEILCGKPYSFASDWWAYGVILYEMLCEKHPFYSNQKEEIVQRILQSPIEFPEYPSRYIKDLILKLLNRDSDKRLGCSCDGGKEIENHPFFEKIDFTKLYHLEIKPPFKPNVEDSFDIQYFDTQFTEEPISNNISEGNIYNKNDYNYDEDKYEEDKYDIYNEDNDNNYYKRESNDYDYERNECYQDDNDYYNDSNNYDNHDYEENDNEYDSQDSQNYDKDDNANYSDYYQERPRSKRYSTINHYSINYDHKDESMNYINEYEENGNISIEQQRLNNGWGSDDDEDIIDDSYNKPKQYSRDEEDYTKSYIETQEQRIKNGW